MNNSADIPSDKSTNRFRQHIPSFISTDNAPQWFEFKTTKDLLELDVVKQWALPMDGKPFSHFAVYGNSLMAIHDDSFHWWCVGHIEYPERLDLPEWKGGKYKAELKDGSLVVLKGKNVVSVCYNTLKLKDGTTAKRLA